MNTMEYKGYTARIDYDGEDEVFVGRLLGLRAMVSFHADTVAKLKREMQVAVDEYVASCEKRGEPPEKPMSGQFALRMPPEVHGRAAIFAEASGKSLNQLITELLEQLTRSAKTDKAILGFAYQKKSPTDLGKAARPTSGQAGESRVAAKKSVTPTSKHRTLSRTG